MHWSTPSWLHRARKSKRLIGQAGSGGFRAARPQELAEIWSWLEDSWALSTYDDLVRWHGRAPEEIVVAESGPGAGFAVFGRWRDMPDLGSVFALVCDERHDAALLDVVLGALAARGFREVVSPLVDDSGRGRYARFGFVPFQEVDVFEKTDWSMPAFLEPAQLADFAEPARAGLMDLDGASFEPFWRLDGSEFDHHRRQGVCRTAHVGDALVGYLIVSVVRGAATLSRLAVAPDWRGRGIGGQLVADALAWARGQDASGVFVSTQGYNQAAQALYRKFGFRPRAGNLHILKHELGTPVP